MLRRRGAEAWPAAGRGERELVLQVATSGREENESVRWTGELQTILSCRY